MYKYVSVIVSTYNSPKWLEKVIIGYNSQNYRFFELIIADDGSSDETRNMIESYKAKCFFPIKHVWHEDLGFRKTEILNKAIAASSYDYLIFSDGDCVPRADFVECHFKNREEGFFLSGGYHKLSMEVSEKLSPDDIITGNGFDIEYLKSIGMKSSFRNNKLATNTIRSYLLNYLTPTTPSWNGHNASGWKKDLLAVNGFDERMQYGGEDREFGERMMNMGTQSKQIRYSTVCIHLDHARGYVKPEMIEKNLKIRKETKDTKRTWTEFGIEKTRQL